MMSLPKGPSPCHSSPLPAEEHIHSLHIHPHAIDHSLQHLKDKEWKEGLEVIASEGKLLLNGPESSNQTKLSGYKKWPRRLENSVLRLCGCQPSRKKLTVSKQTVAFIEDPLAFSLPKRRNGSEPVVWTYYHHLKISTAAKEKASSHTKGQGAVTLSFICAGCSRPCPISAQPPHRQ